MIDMNGEWRATTIAARSHTHKVEYNTRHTHSRHTATVQDSHTTEKGRKKHCAQIHQSDFIESSEVVGIFHLGPLCVLFAFSLVINFAFYFCVARNENRQCTMQYKHTHTLALTQSHSLALTQSHSCAYWNTHSPENELHDADVLFFALFFTWVWMCPCVVLLFSGLVWTHRHARTNLENAMTDKHCETLTNTTENANEATKTTTTTTTTTAKVMAVATGNEKT